MSPKRGCRVILQSHFEKQKETTYPVFPKQIIYSVIYDHDDSFFNHLKLMVLQTLRKDHINNHGKRSFCAIGHKENLLNFQEENKKSK